MPIRAVLLDVFDTLVDNSTHFWLKSFETICAAENLPVSPQGLWDRWKPLEMGFRRRRLDLATMTTREPFETYGQAWERCFRQTFQEMGLQGDPEAATRQCVEDLGRRPILPGVADALGLLCSARPLAALSNADRSFLDPLLDHHGLRGFFKAVVCSEDARLYKPHPGVFRLALERLGAEPGEAVHVGDALEEDVWGASVAGLRSAWVDRLGRGLPPGGLARPDLVVAGVAELPRALEEAEERESPAPERRG